MRKLPFVVLASLAAAVLALLGSCTRQAGPSYPPGQVKQYRVPAGKLSMNLSLYLPGG